MFRQSSHLHFHLPFNDVQYQDRIQIDCEYVESLSIVEGYYYLRIPLVFYDWELKSSILEEEDENSLHMHRMMSNETNLERRVKIHCCINHSNSMKVQVNFLNLALFFLFFLGSIYIIFCLQLLVT